MKDEEQSVPFTAKQSAWVVYVNSDLTEGRGSQVPVYICRSQTTAIRLGRRKDVQGCDAAPSERTLYRIDGEWYGPVSICPPTPVDIDTDKRIEVRNAAIERARKAGLSEEDIKEIYQQISIP